MTKAPVNKLNTVKLIFVGWWGVLRFFLSLIVGTEGTAYTVPALDLLFIFSLIFLTSTAFEAGELIKSKLHSEKTDSVRKIISYYRTTQVANGIVAFLLPVAVYRLLLLKMGDTPYRAQIVLITVPAAVLFALFSYFIGIFYGCGYRKIAFRLVYAFMITASFTCGIFGFLLHSKGSRLALLLRNPSYAGFYGAVGTVVGLNAATLLLAAVSVIIYLSLKHSLRAKLNVYSEYGRENALVLKKNYRNTILSEELSNVLYLCPITLFYFISLFAYADEFDEAVYGAFCGRCFYVFFGVVYLLAAPFTGYLKTLHGITKKGTIGKFRNAFGILFRNYLFFVIPFALFFVSASKVYSALGGTIKDDSVIVACFRTSILVLFIGINVFFRTVIPSLKKSKIYNGFISAEFILQVVLFVVIAENVGVTEATQYALLFFYGLSAFTVMLLSGNLTVNSNRWINNAVRSFSCAVVACLPTMLLSYVLYDVAGALPAFIVLIIVYTILYFVISVLLNAVDMKNLHLLPGGSFLYSLFSLVRVR